MKIPLAGLLSLWLGSSLARAAPVDLAPALPGAVQPQLAVAPSGRLCAVFGRGTSIYAMTSEDGRTFTAPVEVGALEKLALGMRRGPRVAATDKRLLITAISHADGNLHTWASVDAGATWHEGSAINTVAHSAREGLHAMAGNGHGTVAVAWLDDRGGPKELEARLSSDGGATWLPETKVYASPDGHICECCHPSLTIDPAGHVSVMWRNWLGGARDLWTSTTIDTGRTWKAAVKLGDGAWKINACPMDGGGIAADARGALHTVWRRDRTVFGSSPGAPEQKLAEGAAQPVIAIGEGQTAIAWEQGGSIQWQQGTAPVSRVAAGRAPALVRDDALSGYFLAWENEGRVMGQFLPDQPAH